MAEYFSTKNLQKILGIFKLNKVGDRLHKYTDNDDKS